jgi:spermidine synthase
VDRDADGQLRLYVVLTHGTTLHGRQQKEPFSGEPLAYYHRTGPLGQLFAADPPAARRAEHAVIGLGAGAVAAYGRLGQRLTFYEIDPVVPRIAEDREYFTFLKDSKAQYDIVLGDARLKLAEHGKPGQYGLIVVDAFSSDAIPVHLLTKEAVQLYLDRLAPDGIIALHISNHHLDLGPVVGRIAAELGLVGLEQWDYDTAPGKEPSRWVLLARSRDHFAGLADTAAGAPARWKPLTAPAGAPLWTDDYSAVTSVLNWPMILHGRAGQ